MIYHINSNSLSPLSLDGCHTLLRGHSRTAPFWKTMHGSLDHLLPSAAVCVTSLPFVPALPSICACPPFHLCLPSLPFVPALPSICACPPFHLCLPSLPFVPALPSVCACPPFHLCLPSLPFVPALPSICACPPFHLCLPILLPFSHFVHCRLTFLFRFPELGWTVNDVQQTSALPLQLALLDRALSEAYKRRSHSRGVSARLAVTFRSRGFLHALTWSV
ncbi:hypothetical protein BLNAU_21683 [Blattamonas nauphoetae]|uniref:Uncharacterized protein n=1 Tax=Blattamonas nauphoetae TaxID=2049346 RepID=A0ABQ9WV52_9EUKA|nr:hypothetical protein BLNAU_21683 [Blattamonas nauphoetae]